MSKSTMITGSINLSKIDKSRLYEGKNGDKYLNVVMWLNEETDDYGNHMSIQQSVTQQEKNNGVKPQYIGNGKIFERQKPQGNGLPKSTDFEKGVGDDPDDDLPF